MANPVHGAGTFDVGVGMITQAAASVSAYCSPWMVVLTLISTFAISRLLNSCKRQARQLPPVQIPIPAQLDLAHPGNVFLNPARFHEIPANGEMLVAKWSPENDPREVCILRTVQRDLICQVFDRMTRKSNRRFIGERGEYTQKEAEEFIRNRTPRLVNSLGGVFAVFFSVHERILKIWKSAQHEIFLLRNENNDKIDFVVSFINEERIERVAAGVAKKIQPWIAVWQANVPQIDLAANGVVQVSFPNAAPPNALLPPAQQVVQPVAQNALLQDLSTNPKSFSIDTCYIDGIPTRTATKNRITTVLGYSQSDGFAPYWSYAPFSDGSVLRIDGQPFHSLFVKYQWREKPPLQLKIGELGYRDQASEANGIRNYQCHEDTNGRQYFLIPANGGWVPVRHPTDPSCGNWLAKGHTTKMIYDTHRNRWPACEGIDYRKHGFMPQDENNKTWWPIGNGPFNPSFSRLKDPYYPESQTLDREKSRIWLMAQAALAAAAANFGYVHGLAARREGINLNNHARELEAVGNGLNFGIQAMQMAAPFALNEAQQNDYARMRAQREHVTQKTVLELLEQQDAHDRGEEVIRAATIADLPLVQELLDGGPIPRELRDQAVILAASSGFSKIVKTLIDRTDTEARILKAAQFTAKENNYSAVLAILKEHRNRERAVPRG